MTSTGPATSTDTATSTAGTVRPRAITPVVADAVTGDFFAAARRGAFLLRRRPDGTVLDPQAPDPADGEVTAFDAAGTATVVSASVVHARDGDGTVAAHHTVGVVELDEGPWWWAELLEAPDVVPGRDDPGALVGRRVRAHFVPSGPEPEHEPIPVFVLEA